MYTTTTTTITNDNKQSEKRAESVLEMNEKGVFIYDDDSNGGMVTWKIDAPVVEVMSSDNPTAEPSTSVSIMFCVLCCVCLSVWSGLSRCGSEFT